MPHKTAILTLILVGVVFAMGIGSVWMYSSAEPPTTYGTSRNQPRTNILAPLLSGYPPGTKIEEISTEDARLVIGANDTLYVRSTDSSGKSHELYVAYWRAGNVYSEVAPIRWTGGTGN